VSVKGRVESANERRLRAVSRSFFALLRWHRLGLASPPTGIDVHGVGGEISKPV
jgi:hypothetical protein